MTAEGNPTVGMCLGDAGGVIAVTRAEPLRLVGLAVVNWPDGMADPQTRRNMIRARQELRLPRWQAVSVVLGPDDADRSKAGRSDEDTLAGSAELLARSGLIQSRIIDPDRAISRWGLAEIAPAFGVLTDAAQLAVGAALARLTQEPVSGRGQAPAMVTVDEVCAGWAVQPLGTPDGRPTVVVSAGQRADER